jgi:hypothetical protein
VPGSQGRVFADDTSAGIPMFPLDLRPLPTNLAAAPAFDVMLYVDKTTAARKISPEF